MKGAELERKEDPDGPLLEAKGPLALPNSASAITVKFSRKVPSGIVAEYVIMRVSETDTVSLLSGLTNMSPNFGKLLLHVHKKCINFKIIKKISVSIIVHAQVHTLSPY